MDIAADLSHSSPATPFLAGAMFTDSHAAYASRFVDACRKFRIPHVVCRVPTVHRSITPKGSEDLRYTKANFVHFLLERYGRPCLYMDIDCYFEEYPSKIGHLAENGYDFAIYNWFADEHTEAYLPFPVTVNAMDGEPMVVSNRFYSFSHSVDYYATDQLFCSGGVQFYGSTTKAKTLLRLWYESIARFPGASDDECLHFSFNNGGDSTLGLKTSWLEKSYMRLPWWIYVPPIINHPDFPDLAQGFIDIPESRERRRFYLERTEARVVEYVFPKDCVIDTQEHQLLKLAGTELVLAGPLGREIWT